MKLVTLLVGLLIVCSSSVALAKGGVGDQLLVLPPMSGGNYYQVVYLNKSEGELTVTFEFFDYDGSLVFSTPTPIPVPAGALYDIGLFLSSTSHNSAYAHVSWFGKKGDLLITVCSLDDVFETSYKACVKAN